MRFINTPARQALALLLTSAAFTSMTALAQPRTLFEGFYRIEKARKHAGYLVQRLSEDAKAGTKTLVTYVRLDHHGEQAYQSVKTVSRAGSGLPVSSEHRSTDTTGPLGILAKFTPGGQASVTYYDLKTKKVLKKEAADPAPFVSGNLFFVADLPRFKKDAEYRYHAFSEERGRVATGTLRYESEKQAGDTRVLQVVDDFLGQPMENFVTPAGIPLGSRLAAEELVAYWVPAKDDAVGLLEYPVADIKAVFGDLPQGLKNPWTEVSEFRANNFIASFPRSEGSRRVSSAAEKKKKPKAIPLPTRRF